ncbi:MAG: hypothetical protein P9X22_06670 [Candidatus Zapsychrus exili]|nr:hypothetical protein [Candidatus Zapsychrus exili]
MIKKIFFIITIIFLFSLPTSADTITLSSGDIIEGNIVEKTDDYIKIDSGYGVEITYYLDEIKNIDYKEIELETESTISEQELEEDYEYIESEYEHVEDVLEEDTLNVKNSMGNKGDFTKGNNDAPKKYEIGKSQEDYLFYKIQQESVEKKEKKEWEEGEYLSSQINKQIQGHFNSVKMLVGTLINKLKSRWDTLVLKVKDEQPTTYNSMAFLGLKIDFFIKNSIEYVKSIDMRIMVLIAILFYISFLLPLMFIAKKLGFKKSWLILIPVVQLFLFVRMAGKPHSTAFLLLLPIFNIFVFIGLCSRISGFLQKPPFLGTLMIIPGINLLVAWYLALSKTK